MGNHVWYSKADRRITPGRKKEDEPCWLAQASRGAHANRETDVGRFMAAGFSEVEIAEIIAHVALNIFTNYFNKTGDVAMEFPVVTIARA